jgi:hypothetical protein
MSTRIPLHANTVVSYAYTVTDSTGNHIGTLQGFTTSANRPLDRVRQIMNEEDDTKEIVPGRTDFTITVDRLETYGSNALKALGFEVSSDVSKIVDPINITEVVTNAVGQIRTIHYMNCWVQSWSKTIREGTITVTESVTLWPEKISISENV